VSKPIVRAETATSPLAGLTVESFARRGIVTCAPQASLREVAWAMSNNQIHAVFVADDRAPQPPVILDGDLVAAVASGHFDRLRAADIASTEAPTVFDDDDLDRAVELLGEHGVGHLVVRDAHRTPVGVISTLDIVRAIAGESPEDDVR
jgi:predicted transcriptional regulator